MTAYEYADLAASNYAISFTILSFLIALASAYFVAAYVMGRSLSRVQLSLLNVVYGLWMSGLAWIAARFLNRATELGALALSLDDAQSGKVFFAADFVPFLMITSTLLLSYGFMWSVRHSKDQRPL